MIFLLCLALLDDTNWKITETGVYQPLKPNEVVVREDGHILILNFAEAQILHFDADGRKIGTIGRKGKGPGEFTYPIGFYYSEGKIYILDMLTSQISVFAAGGTFETQFATPSRGLTVVKISTGWVYGNWSLFNQTDDPALYCTEESFQNAKQIRTFEDAGFNQGMWTIDDDNGTTKTTFSPISKRPLVRVSRDGKEFYLGDLDVFRIQVYDNKGQLKHTIQRKEPRLPFDTEWADGKLAERLEERKARGRSGKVDKQYPETFPAIRDIIVDPNGNLAFDRWRGRPDDSHYAVTLTPTGEEVDPAYNWETLSRLAGTYGGNAYILIFNGESEEAGLAQVPAAQAEAFVRDNPVVFDGNGGHSISISL